MEPVSEVSQQILGLLFMALMAGTAVGWSWAFRRFKQGLPILPRAEVPAVPWKLGSVLLTLFVYFAVATAVQAAYFTANGTFRVAAQRNGAKPAASPPSLSYTDNMVLISGINGIALFLIPITLRISSKARLEHFGVQLDGCLFHAWQGLAAFAMLTPIVYALNAIAVQIWHRNAHSLEKMMRQDSSYGVAQLAFLSAVVLAPAAEELIFRGVLQGWLTRAFRGTPRIKDDEPGLEHPDDLLAGETLPLTENHPSFLSGILERLHRNADGAAVVTTSALFAVMHWEQWPAPFAIFLLSLGLGMVYQRTGSLIASFTMHAMFNGFAVGVLLLTQKGP